MSEILDQQIDILNLLYILGFLPVLQVFEVVDECGILEVTSLRQEVKIVRVPQALHKLHFNLQQVKWAIQLQGCRSGPELVKKSLIRICIWRNLGCVFEKRSNPDIFTKKHHVFIINHMILLLISTMVVIYKFSQFKSESWLLIFVEAFILSRHHGQCSMIHLRIPILS